MSNSSVAVAICTRHRPTDLAACLISVLADSLVTEVLVSADDTDRETDDVVEELLAVDERVTFLRGPRRGLAANRNTCIAACRSDYLLFLDDDARLAPGFVKAAARLAQGDQIVTGWEDKAGQKVEPHHPDFFGFQRLIPKGELRAIVINATLFPTSFLRRRPFDEFYTYGSEEIDIAQAARTEGTRIIQIDAGNAHLHSAEGREGQQEAATRSRLYFSIRRYRAYDRSRPRLLLYLFTGPAHALLVTFRSRGSTRRRNALGLILGAVIAGLRSRGPKPLAQTEAQASTPSVSVVVPTYRRPDLLRSCLAGLAAQHLPPDEVIVVARSDDEGSRHAIATYQPMVQEVLVSEPGMGAALQAGAQASKGDVIAFLDDDAVPRRDWIERLLAGFASPGVGAVGGRDLVHTADGTVDGAELRVGELTAWGVPVGNHHLGAGRPRVVKILKGCNSAYRREVLGFPIGLRGKGAQVAHDLATSLHAGQSSLALVYDPGLLVDHYPGPRFDDDTRNAPSRRARLDATYNTSYAICSVYPRRRWLHLGYHFIVGTRASPGLVRSLAGWFRHECDVQGRFWSTQRTVARAVCDSVRSPLGFVELKEATVRNRMKSAAD